MLSPSIFDSLFDLDWPMMRQSNVRFKSEEERVNFYFDVPGLTEGDIEARINNDTLIIQGENEARDRRYAYSVALPKLLDRENIHASLKKFPGGDFGRNRSIRKGEWFDELVR